MKKYIWISFAVLGVLFLAPDLMATFAQPFNSKGKEVTLGLLTICKVLCGIAFVGGLIWMVLNAVQRKPLPWGVFGTILVVGIVVGSYEQFSRFFGF